MGCHPQPDYQCQSNGQSRSSSSAPNYAGFCICALFVMPFTYAFVSAHIDWAHQMINGVAWWPIGKGGTALLVMCLMLPALSAIGGGISPPTRSEWQDQESSVGSMTLRLACFFASSVIFIMIGRTLIGMAFFDY